MRSITTKVDRRLPEKAHLLESPQQRAREQARTCYQSILRRAGSVEEGIRAYHQIGKALIDLVVVEHRGKYAKNLVGEFIDEWTRMGGFRFGPGQAKYFRVFARAFKDEKLLKNAIDAGIGWTTLRELSGSELDAHNRKDIIDRVSRDKLAISDVVAEVRAITRADRKDLRKLMAKSAKKVPATVARRLAALAKSLKRLDMVMKHLSRIEKLGPQDAIDLCTSVISAGTLASQCGLPWDERAGRAKRELERARGKIGKK